MTKIQLAAKLGVTPEQIAFARREILGVWDMIGDDYIDCFEGGFEEACEAHGGEMAMIAEAVIDADRLRSHGHADSHWVYAQRDPIKAAFDILTAR